MLICKEISKEGVVHYHGIIYDNISRATPRNWAKKVFPEGKGNEFWSQANIYDLEGFEGYVCKGVSKEEAPEIIVNSKGVDISARHKQYWDIHASVRKKAKAKVKTHKEEFRLYFENIRKEIQKERGIVNKVLFRDIAEAYVDFLKEFNLDPTPSHSCKSMFMGIYLQNSNCIIDLTEEMLHYAGLSQKIFDER